MWSAYPLARGRALIRHDPLAPTDPRTDDREATMRTLHVGFRVADRGRSLAFYAALGYEVVGTVPDSPIGSLTMLKLPGDEFVTVELVHDPEGPAIVAGTSFTHLAVQVDSMDDVFAALRSHGIAVEEPASPDGSTDFLTAKVADPDGREIELVQWPDGHAAGMSAADWPG